MKADIIHHPPKEINIFESGNLVTNGIYIYHCFGSDTSINHFRGILICHVDGSVHMTIPGSFERTHMTLFTGKIVLENEKD